MKLCVPFSPKISWLTVYKRTVGKSELGNRRNTFSIFLEQGNTQCISGQSANRKRQLTVHPKIVSDV